MRATITVDRLVTGLVCLLFCTPPLAVALEPGATSISPPPAAQAAVYGPVRRTDTLWSIAAGVRPDDSISVHRMMLALLEANPEAFATRNVNALYAGAVLRIPAREEIGPGDDAAVAEVRRQHAQWEQRGAGRRASPPASAATPATPEAEAEPEPGGRVELASPETTGGTAPQDGDAVVRALRRDLALAREETDALQRQNDEIERRLAEAEDRIGELRRLVELKDEEIAALEAGLHARAEAATAPIAAASITTAPITTAEERPQPASPGVETGPTSASPDVAVRPEPLPVELAAERQPLPVEIAADRQPVQATLEAAAEPAPDQVEAEAPPMPSRPEPGPIPAVAEDEPKPAPAVAGDEPKPTLAATEDEPKPTLAQVERAREPATVGVQREPEAGPAGTAPESLSSTLRAAVENPVYAASGAGVLLMGLGVAALLVRRRASATDGGAPDLVGESRDSRTGEEDIFAELEAVTADLEDEAGRDRLDVAETDRGAHDAIELNLDALAGGHDDSEPLDDEASDSFAISYLADLADEGEDATTEAAGGTPDDLEYLLRRYGDAEAEVEAREPPPASGAEASSDSGGNREPPAADRRDGAETQPPSIGDLGDDEMQTKTDLAQMYMEMGDADRARAFLEAVMAEGDAEQRETAREMLARLA